MTSHWQELNIVLSYYGNFTPFIFFIFCACFGSYFNLFAYRWPLIQEKTWLNDIKEWFGEKNWPLAIPNTGQGKNLSLAQPASFCPHCGATIPPYFNIPVFGWLLLRGKSKCCRKPISPKYPIFEFLCGTAGSFAWLHYQNVEMALVFLLFAMPLFMAAQTDLESMMLPDSVTAFIIITGTFAVLYFPSFHLTPKDSFLGGIFCYATLQAIRVLGTWMFKREAMGQGDPKFFAAIGVWIGPMAIPQTLLFASVFGLLFAILLKLDINKKNTEVKAIPFGPFLALGGAISYLYPNLFNI